MATLPTLSVQSCAAAGSFTDGLGSADTGAIAAALEPIGSADDLDWVQGPAGAVGGTDARFVFASGSALPTDFLSMTTLAIQVRVCRSVLGDDTVGPFNFVIYNNTLTTVLAAATGSGSYMSSGSIPNSITFANNLTAGFTYVDTSASRSVWQQSLLLMRSGYTTSMGNDSARAKLSALELTGSYTPVTSLPLRPRRPHRHLQLRGAA